MIDEIKNYMIENIQNLSLFIDFFIIMILFYIYKNTKIDRLIRYSIIFSCSIAIICAIGAYYFVEIPNDASFSITQYSSLIRNLLLGLIALISFPFLVWRTVLASSQEKTAQEQLDVANKNAKTANKQADTALKVRIDKLYNDAVEQLSSDKETIRLASILTFQELLNTSDNDDFRKKILDILWLFMVEHSREVRKVNWQFELSRKKYEDNKLEDELIKNYAKEMKKFDKQEKTIKTYHSQFKTIVEILTEHRDTFCNDAWWQDKYMHDVWLCDANLQYAKFAGANLQYANLRNTNLWNADLRNANLQYANLNESFLWDVKLGNANLFNTDFTNANLKKAIFVNNDFKDIGFQHTRLEYVNFMDTKLFSSDLKGVHFYQCRFNNKTRMDNTKLQGCNFRDIIFHFKGTSPIILKDSEYNSKEITIDDVMYPPTLFPDGFNPEGHGMIDVSKKNI